MKSLRFWFCALVVLLLACGARAAPLHYDLTGTAGLYDGVMYTPLEALGAADFSFTMDTPAVAPFRPGASSALSLSNIALTVAGTVTPFPDLQVSFVTYDTGEPYLGQMLYYAATAGTGDSFAWMIAPSGAEQVTFFSSPSQFVGFHADGDRTEPYWRSSSPVELMDVTGFSVTSAAPATGVPEPSYWSLAALGGFALWLAGGVARFRRRSWRRP